jgi:L-2-hydroxyglutarate oxidase
MIGVAVVGGGIVGLASARALQLSGVRSVTVLEAEHEVGLHQTGRNSGVIHSGLYYAPGSARARTCVRGRRSLYGFCRKHGVDHRRTGKLVVAARPGEVPRLNELERRGRANGLEGLERLGPADLDDRYPDLRTVEALHVRETGIVDFAEVARTLARRVREAGGAVRTGCRVVDVQHDGAGLRVVAEGAELEARHLVGCAGLHADRLARACGLETDLRIVPFRGEYYELRSPPDVLTDLPVYPVPDPDLPFLGVHFTPGLDGRVETGPSAVLAFAREGYRRTDVDPGDLGQLLGFPGFWRMAAGHLGVGLWELARSASRRLFALSARRLLPDLSVSDLGGRRAGVRAQAVDRSGRLVRDFRIAGEGRTLHVLNAPSPGATGALAIGSHVASRAVEAWDL